MINSKKFDYSFEKLLEKKEGKNIIKGRFDIEPVPVLKKIEFIIQFFSLKFIEGLTYKLLFWEKDDLLVSFMNSINVMKYSIITSYKNGEVPGVLFIDMDTFNETVFRQLLIHHFNYEIAEDPSLNIRVQICLNEKKSITLLDIYDDRGFDVYVLDS